MNIEVEDEISTDFCPPWYVFETTAISSPSVERGRTPTKNHSPLKDSPVRSTTISRSRSRSPKRDQSAPATPSKQINNKPRHSSVPSPSKVQNNVPLLFSDIMIYNISDIGVSNLKYLEAVKLLTIYNTEVIFSVHIYLLVEY